MYQRNNCITSTSYKKILDRKLLLLRSFKQEYIIKIVVCFFILFAVVGFGFSCNILFEKCRNYILINNFSILVYG